MHRGPRFDGVGDEGFQLRGAGRAHLPQADAAELARANAFDRGDDQGFASRLASAFAGLRRAEVALIDLHDPTQTLPARSHHRSAQLVQQALQAVR